MNESRGTGDFGLRFYLMRGTTEGAPYVLDVVANGGVIQTLWTEDQGSAIRFDARDRAEMLRDAIMAAEHEAGRCCALAMIPEA